MHTQFLIPYGRTRLVPILRGTLQGDSLSPLIFDLMVKPLIRWMKSTQNRLHANFKQPLSLSSKCYAGDATLVAPTIPALEAQLKGVEAFSKWSGIRMNIPNCRLTGYLHKLQNMKTKKRPRHGTTKPPSPCSHRRHPPFRYFRKTTHSRAASPALLQSTPQRDT